MFLTMFSYKCQPSNLSKSEIEYLLIVKVKLDNRQNVWILNDPTIWIPIDPLFGIHDE